MGFIKGAVCRGNIALSVIDDRFWIFFIDPNLVDEELHSEFLEVESNNLRLPDEEGSSASLFTWRKYAKLEKQYFNAREKVVSDKLRESPNLLNLNAVWDGEGRSTSDGDGNGYGSIWHGCPSELRSARLNRRVVYGRWA